MTGEDHILMLFATMYTEHCAVMQFTTQNGKATVLMDVERQYEYVECADGEQKRGQKLGKKLKDVIEYIAGHPVEVKFRLVDSLLPRDEYVQYLNIPAHLIPKFSKYLQAAEEAKERRTT